MKPEQWAVRSGMVCLMLAVVCGALVERGRLQVPGPASTLSVRVAQAAPSASGSWTQTAWTTPNSVLGVAASGTNQYFRPSSGSSFGQLMGTFGVCAGTGAWCQGPDDSAPGVTLRLAGNHKSDAGNLYSSDLNGDGISELLFANSYNGSTTVFNGGWIYWGQGSSSSPNWSASQRTDLLTRRPHGAVVADLNGDGRPEVIFASYGDDTGYNVDSSIYWGQAGGSYGVVYDTGAQTGLPTSAAGGVVVADLNADGRPEVIFANSYDGSSYNIDSHIYWGRAGGPHGVAYSTAARTGLPTSDGFSLAVADLNRDGRPELIFANFYNGSSYNINSYIYWGQAGGPYGTSYSTGVRTDLPTHGGVCVAVADLNNDSYPEVIFANNYNGSTYNINSYIYWGQAGGPHGVTYSAAARTNLPGVGATNVSVADLNSDGQHDVVIQNLQGGLLRVFWGPLPTSGTATNYWDRSHPLGFRGLSLSDLNSDGWVDLVIGRQGTDSYLWQGGTEGRVYFHNTTSAPYNPSPSFALPAQSPPASYASFGPGRGTNSNWTGQPRPVYGTAFPNYGVLESMIMDSGRNGTAWQAVSATTAITAGTGITLFVAASDNLSALNNPAWVQVGAIGDGSWTQALSGVSGRYARYRVVLWRDHTTEASPALEEITFNYLARPAAFSKAAPLSGETGQPTNPTLSWSATSGADHYRYCNNTASGCVPGISMGVATSVTLSGLTPGTTYYWQVRACADAGCTLYTDADGGHWSYTIAVTPSAFSKLAPADGATGQPANLMLSWGTASGVHHYRYCYSTTPGCVPVTDVGTATSAALSGLAAGVTYHWQVRACADAGCTVYSDASSGYWSFTVIGTPAVPGKLTPADGSAGQPANLTLSWGTASGVHHYRYCYATTAGCVPMTDVGTATSAALSGLTAGATYYWQVRACADAGCTIFSDADGTHWAFTIVEAPADFGKTSPVNGATGEPMNAVLSWGAASGATHYRYCVATLPGCVPATSAGAATSVALSGLAAGATYYWQVRACADMGCTVYRDANGGAGWLFTVMTTPGGFNKVSPANGATDQPLSAMLSWMPASGAHHYRYCRATAPGCTPTTSAGSATSAVLNGLTAGTTYHWQVRACGDAWCTAFTDAQGGHWTFTAMTATGFSKAAPAHGATRQPTSVVLSWGTVDGVHHYRYCYAPTPGCVPTTSVGTATSVVLSGLPEGATYYWQVRACMHAACVAFTDAVGGHWAFTVAKRIDHLDNPATRKLAAPAIVRMGELVSYTIVASNSGSVPITAWVTDTLSVSATLVSATPGYVQHGQGLVWSSVVVPAGATAALTITVRAASEQLPGGYTLDSSVQIGTADGQIVRNAPSVMVMPWQAFAPIVRRP